MAPPQKFWRHVLIRNLCDDKVQFTIIFNTVWVQKSFFTPVSELALLCRTSHTEGFTNVNVVIQLAMPNFDTFS
jgi:hypothetical protein